jgi:twitching motility protein PilT
MMSLEELLRQVGSREGSDLHLLAGVPTKIRVHGHLVRVEDQPPDVEALVMPLLDKRHSAIFAQNGEVDFGYDVPGFSRFRVNLFRQHRGLGAVFRRIPSEIPTLEELGIPDGVRRFLGMDRGIVLVTGPTGSGKSSTLAAMLGEINRTEARHVVTIEDPIEYVHRDGLSTFTQREVGDDTASFAEALRSAARQDPDLILLGEMRDRETIRAALTLAEMGNLVFSTVHTNSAARTIDRIVEVFDETEQPLVRTMLATSLKGILSQILCRRADGNGRVAVTELLFTSTALGAIIRSGDTHKVDTLFQAGRGEGMHRMDDTLYRLASEGLVAGDEAYQKANDKSRFSRFLPDDAAKL